MSKRALLAGASFVALDTPSMLAALKPGMIFMDGQVNTIESLRARAQEIQSGNEQLISAADAARRDLTPEEIQQITDNRGELDRIAAQIAAREAVVLPGTGRRTAHEPATDPTQPRATVPAQPRSADAGKCGFRNFGEFALAVRGHAINRLDEQTGNKLTAAIKAAASTYGNEGTGEEGGFVVIPEFRRDIVQTVVGEGSLLARTDRMTIGSNQLVVPKDDTSPWETDKGILAYWEGEAVQIPNVKPALQQLNSRLAKLTALIPVSDELLEDALAIDAYLRRKAPQKMNAKINTAIIRGTGVGQPLGILNSGARVTVAKDSGQTAGTFIFDNIKAMYAQLYRGEGVRPVWLYNPDVLPSLMGMAFLPGAPSPVPVWLPSNSIAGVPYEILFGAPAIPHVACSSVGNEGDVILADMSAYLTATRGADIRTDISIHLFFDQALTAFRFLFRVSGQPWRSTTIKAQQSTSPDLANFVTCATRS